MSGTGYDLSTGIYSQHGRLFQIEYASKNISNAQTVLGVLTSDGVIMATEKIRHNPLLSRDKNPRISNITKNMGLMICGKIPDGKALLKRAREEAENYRDNFGIEIPPVTLVERLSNYVHAHTIYNAYRVVGCAIVISAYNKVTDKFELYMINNDGVYRGYYGCANGKGREIAKTQVEKIYKEKKNSREALVGGRQIGFGGSVSELGV